MHNNKNTKKLYSVVASAFLVAFTAAAAVSVYGSLPQEEGPDLCDFAYLYPPSPDPTLIQAAAYGQLESVEILLQGGAGSPKEYDEALRWAARNGHEEVLKRLLAAGANIHAYDDAAIQSAAQCGRSRIIRILAEHGADIDALQGSPLLVSIRKGHAAAVQTLLDAGADISDGRALVVAVEVQNPGMVEMLLDAGADPAADNQKARQIARLLENQKIIALLESRLRYAPAVQPAPGF